MVYLIFDDENPPRIAYVGHGKKDAYKSLYRHFQTWNDRTRDRSTFDRDTHTVRVIYTRTAAQAERLERALILKHQPYGNPDKLKGYKLTPALEAIADAAEVAPF